MVVILASVLLIESFSRSWSWAIFLVWVLILGTWTKSGIKNIPVAHRGQLLFLGERQEPDFGEGWRWIPFPFGIKVHDCKEQIMELDPLEAITLDDVKVFITTTITYKTVDLDKRSNVQDAEIKRGLDDVRDQVLRVEVAGRPLEEVLKMHAAMGAVMHSELQKSSDRWGVKIIEVIITKVVTDPEVAKDLELKAREVLQREGQMVEFQHFVDRIKQLMELPPIGPGLTREQAIEQVQLGLGKASKTIDAKTLTLDAATTEILAAFLKGRK